ncbi:MAG: hypothetical protein CMN78_02895 [Spirochaetales bacterium]|nr:hypothetical protein [Spirochaetales bacterium]
MAVVLGIVRAHHGAIQVYSRIGEGTKFSVWLPVSHYSAKVSEPEPESPAVEGEGLILVVDDEPDITRVLKRGLEYRGFSVVVAHDGIEGLNIYERLNGEIVAVIADNLMPGFSGEQLAEAIRLDNDSVPIYLISGYSEAELQNRLKDKGITAFLPKPISMEKLATALSRHLPISHRK